MSPTIPKEVDESIISFCYDTDDFNEFSNEKVTLQEKKPVVQNTEYDSSKMSQLSNRQVNLKSMNHLNTEKHFFNCKLSSIALEKRLSNDSIPELEDMTQDTMEQNIFSNEYYRIEAR